jgi:3-oxoacyl-[acyl-carrier-protein] synthase-1
MTPERRRVFITGTGGICAAGSSPGEIFQSLLAGKVSLRDIADWDTTTWPVHSAGQVGTESRKLVADRKLLKLIRRSEVFGIYAGEQALENSGVVGFREQLDEDAQRLFSGRFGVYVGAGGGSYASQYDFLPLITAAQGNLREFGEKLPEYVNPMWLLQTLPNNVLCHFSIRNQLKGSNSCITNHSAGSALAVMDAFMRMHHGEVDRAVVIGHDAPIEPQSVLYYHSVGLVNGDRLAPFDAQRNGSVFGEGSAALVLESEESARARNAEIQGEVLGVGYASEAIGLLPVREDGDGVSRAIRSALDSSGLQPSDIGMIVAHANGTQLSDQSEAVGIARIFGESIPPVTGFKWAFGHLIAAAGLVDTVIALQALRAQQVPGLATLETVDPELDGFPVSRHSCQPTSDIALLLSRGFGGSNAALVVRSCRD